MSDLKLGEPIPTGIPGIEPVSTEVQDAAEAVVRPFERSIDSAAGAYPDTALLDQLLLLPMKLGLSMALALTAVLVSPIAMTKRLQTTGILERFDVRQVAQRLHAEARQEVRGRYVCVRRARGRARGPEPIEAAPRRLPITSRLTSLPKIFDSSPRVTGWKYPTAISTIASNSDRAAAPPRVGAEEARIVSAKRGRRVRCCQPPATDTSS